uniref:uncharacterized protein LOC122598287 n=1 Tax=Erigeron canadensis TaxID=72917 RepID=UPI001CB8970D|nr:uncharacterized protein LOC122598287 [Erigeron canadensis]
MKKNPTFFPFFQLDKKMVTLQEPQLDLESGGGCGDVTGRQSEVPEKGRLSFVAVDVENGGEVNILLKDEKDCRICHMSLDVNSEESENGIPIELGCCCKDDLAVAHKHCAEAWFKIRGNRTCEICGSIAKNIAGADEVEMLDQWNEVNGSTPSRAPASGETMATLDARNFWQGHRFLNFLLACMVFAFVISWLFHFNVPS